MRAAEIYAESAYTDGSEFQHHPTLYYKAIECILKGEDPTPHLPPKKADPYAGLSPELAAIQREIDTLKRQAAKERQMNERVRINARLRELTEQLANLA